MNSKIPLNNELLAKLKMRIYIMEKENFKTQKLTDTEMVEKIKKTIVSEVNRNDN